MGQPARGPSAMKLWPLLPVLIFSVVSALLVVKDILDLLVIPLLLWFVSWALQNGPFIVWVLVYIIIVAFILWGPFIHNIPWLLDLRRLLLVLIIPLFALILAKYVLDLLVIPLLLNWMLQNSPFFILLVFVYIIVATLLWGLSLHIILWILLLFKAPPGKRDNPQHLDLDITGVAFPVIRGATIIARTVIEITSNQPLDYHWEGHGFKVHIPAGAISEERGPVTLCIQASLSGDYQLPDDGVLVSGVYWLSLHPHVKKFDKKVTITIQHCASIDDSKLSFVTAQCTQCLLPYSFETLSPDEEVHGYSQTELSTLPYMSQSPSERTFSKSGECTINVDHFSAFGILSWFMGLRKNYAFCTHYIKRQLNCYEAHITVTPDLDLQLKDVRTTYKREEKGPSISTEITGKEISLDFKLDSSSGTWEKDGWELQLLISPPKLPKGTLDGYQPGQVIPHFAIQMKLKDNLNPRPLSQKVEFVGVDLPNCIVLSRDPVPPQAETPFQRRLPTLSELLVLWKKDGSKVEIIGTVSPKWREIGIHLNFDRTGVKLDRIKANHRGVESCCQAMFQHWLEGNGVQPASWTTLIQILNDCRFVNLAAEVRDALIQ